MDSARKMHSQDRFDTVPVGGVQGQRVGAHRAAPRSRSFGKWLLAVLAATVLCTAAGIFLVATQGVDETIFSKAALSKVDHSATDKQAAKENSAPEQLEAAVDQVDASRGVAVVNAADINGLAAAVADHVKKNSLGIVGVVVTADGEPIPESTLYYANSEYAAGARALARELGGLPAVESSEYASYGADYVLVLGTEYAGPGAPAQEISE